MQLDYTITFTSEIKYPSAVCGGHWQLLLLPEVNETQEIRSVEFANSLLVNESFSINGFGNKTIRFNTQKPFDRLRFKLKARVIKEIASNQNKIFSQISVHKADLQQLNFKANHHTFLRETPLTTLPPHLIGAWEFKNSLTVVDNFNALSTIIHETLKKTKTKLDAKLSLSQASIQEATKSDYFAHVFCAALRKNYFPARIVSGYRYEKNDDLCADHIHVWTEIYIPDFGYIGYDPYYMQPVDEQYIKIAVGADFSQCEPYKEVLFFEGDKKTKQSIQIKAQQQ